jgi:hypothetical protein
MSSLKEEILKPIQTQELEAEMAMEEVVTDK